MSALRPILIVGSSGHAKVVIDAIERCRIHRICGLIDSVRPVGELTLGYPVLGTVDEVVNIARSSGPYEFFVAIGDNWQRARIVRELREQLPELVFATIVHPSAHVAGSARLGQGCIVVAGAIINADARVGDFCIVNSGASLDHDSVLGDYASLAPGSIVGGSVRIGAHSAIGLGANVIHKRSIGAHAVIGAGALIIRDVPDRSVAFGSPAKVVRQRVEGEPYL